MFTNSQLPYRSHMLQRHSMKTKQDWRPTVPALQAKSAGKSAGLSDMPGLQVPEQHSMKAMSPYRGGGGMPGIPALPAGYIMIPDPNAPIRPTFGQRLAAQAGNGRKKGKAKGCGKMAREAKVLPKTRAKTGKSRRVQKKAERAKGRRAKANRTKARAKAKRSICQSILGQTRCPLQK